MLQLWFYLQFYYLFFKSWQKQSFWNPTVLRQVQRFTAAANKDMKLVPEERMHYAGLGDRGFAVTSKCFTQSGENQLNPSHQTSCPGPLHWRFASRTSQKLHDTRIYFNAHWECKWVNKLLSSDCSLPKFLLWKAEVTQYRQNWSGGRYLRSTSS